MVSLSSIKIFLKLNSILISLGTMLYTVFYFTNYITILYRLLSILIVKLVKNYFIIYLIDNGTSHKKSLHNNNIESPYSISSFYHVVKFSILDTITSEFMIYLSIFRETNYLYDLLTFIPVSFIFEIIFDFFHYSLHKLCHTNKILYQYVHKEHHKDHHVSIITTYHQSILDVILTNSIPVLISLFFVKISLYQYCLIIIYKTFIEISGHTGKHLYPNSSFPQFIWLPKLFGIELYAEDHAVHHTNIRHNFSKRFSLWDKVFCTYLPYLPRNKLKNEQINSEIHSD